MNHTRENPSATIWTTREAIYPHIGQIVAYLYKNYVPIMVFKLKKWNEPTILEKIQ